MNPIPSVELASKSALLAIINSGDAPLLAGSELLASLDADTDALPQIIIKAVAKEVIAYNLTFEVGLAIGIVTDANPEVTQPTIAYAMATQLGRLIALGDFATALATAAEAQDAPFVLVSPPRVTDAISVEVEGDYAYQQAASLTFHVQF